MEYRCVATSIPGFVQQLASCYLPHGYWFYVFGYIPEGKCPLALDEKLIDRYGIGISRQSRARRKAAGIANLHYLRYERRFLLLATHGHHPFFDHEAGSIRDARHCPIKIAGYAISVKPGGYLRKRSRDCPTVSDPKSRVHVQIHQPRYQELKAYFLDLARRRSTGHIANELRRLPYEPYAPVRQQLLNILRLVNRLRRYSGREAVSPQVLRWRRQIVHPFEPIDLAATKDAPAALTVACLENKTEIGSSQPDGHDGPTNQHAFDGQTAVAPPEGGGGAIDEDFLEWALTYVEKKLH
jgi:hypothetical protein